MRTLRTACQPRRKEIKMKKAVTLAVLAALAGGSISAEAAGRHHRGYNSYRPVYSVYRSPRFVPPPTASRLYFFEFIPTNRVNTHMY